MLFTGLLRAQGDALRAMWVTLGGAIVTAFLDPLLIFGAGLGVEGAAITVCVARATFVVIGWRALARHGLLRRPRVAEIVADAPGMATIAGPAVLTNLAPSVASAFLTHLFAGYGPDAIAAAAVIDRLTPVAFGGLFALSGAIGPILAQNWGASRFDRMGETLHSCVKATLVYAATVWLLLIALRWPLAGLFGLKGDAAELFAFFCLVGGAIWFFNGLLFLGNAAFNNLGFPLRSSLLNWGRATLGTVPPAYLGSALFGTRGIVAGMGIGSLVFGVAGLLLARRTVVRLAERSNTAAPARDRQGLSPGNWRFRPERVTIPRTDERTRRAAGPCGHRGIMFNPLDMVQAAGGPEMQAMARQFGLTVDQTQRAFEALMPALTLGLQRGAGLDPTGFARMFSAPETARTAMPLGLDALGQMFGSAQLMQAVLQQASTASGVGSQVLRQMLPMMAGAVVASIVHVMLNQPQAEASRKPAPAAAPPAPMAFVSLWTDMARAFMTPRPPPPRRRPPRRRGPPRRWRRPARRRARTRAPTSSARCSAPARRFRSRISRRCSSCSRRSGPPRVRRRRRPPPARTLARAPAKGRRRGPAGDGRARAAEAPFSIFLSRSEKCLRLASPGPACRTPVRNAARPRHGRAPNQNRGTP